MIRLRRRPRRHDCKPPRGAVYDVRWACPTCGSAWVLIEHANYSEWERRDG